ncbi:Hypothetical predicted protein, partial [Lynx pardinus]
MQDEGLARQLVELGYRGTGEVVKREDFEARKAAIEIARLAERTQKKNMGRSRKPHHAHFPEPLTFPQNSLCNVGISTIVSVGHCLFLVFLEPIPLPSPACRCYLGLVAPF